MKLLIWSSQVPPFWQGYEAHSSTSMETNKGGSVTFLIRRKHLAKLASKVMSEESATDWHEADTGIKECPFGRSGETEYFIYFQHYFSWLTSGRQVFIHSVWRVCQAQQSRKRCQQ